MAEKVKELLNKVESGEIVLPEFQREFEWNKSDSKDLMISLYKNYPIGSILRWQTTKPPKIKNNAIDKEKRNMFKVLLDGQQRLTVLYLLVRDEIPPYYDEDELSHDPRDLHIHLKKGDIEYVSKKQAKNPEWVKVTDCFCDRVDELEIAEEMSEEGEFKQLLKTYQVNLEKLLDIKKRDIPVQDLGDEADVHEAIKVFDKINTKGEPLSKSQIALAHMSSEWEDIRQNMKDKKNSLADRGFEFELDFYVKCMVALTTDRINYEESYNKDKDALKEKWDKLAKEEDGIFDFLFNILEEEAFIQDNSYLSSRAVLIPIIKYLDNKEEISLSRQEKNHFFRWMYLAMMWTRYSGSADSDLDHDLSIIEDSETPIEDLVDVIRQERGGRLKVDASDLNEETRQSSFYTILKILTRANKPIDWKSGEPLTKGRTIESHHIFPTSRLYGEATDDSGEVYDSSNHRSKANEIANRAMITPKTNKKIGNDKPAEYLPEVRDKHPRALESQFIPDNSELWKIENYEEFLANRRKVISQKINQLLEELISEGSTEEDFDARELIAREESKKVEFKETLLYHIHKEQPDTELRAQAVKEICSFMNTEGGYLIIGVSDDGKVKGIERDLSLMENDTQKFEEQLEQEANNRLEGPNIFSMYVEELKFEEIDGNRVCVIQVKPCPSGPVFYKLDDGEKELIVRSGSSARKLEADQINEYIRERWG